MTNFPIRLERQFHAQVSARHHHAIRLLENRIEIRPGFRLLNLGHDRDLRIVVLEMNPQAQDIVPFPYDSATMSTPFSMPNRRSATSFLVSEWLLTFTRGRLMPL